MEKLSHSLFGLQIPAQRISCHLTLTLFYQISCYFTLTLFHQNLRDTLERWHHWVCCYHGLQCSPCSQLTLCSVLSQRQQFAPVGDRLPAKKRRVPMAYTVGFSTACILSDKIEAHFLPQSRKNSGRRKIRYPEDSSFANPWYSPSFNRRKLNRKHGLTLVACSTPSYTGRVGTHSREGNVTLASFDINPKKFLNGQRVDFTETLSGVLPLVVAGTAAAALIKPATFAWVTKEYYAPALGGIMLSIGVQLSVKDFALAFQRPLPLTIGYLAQYLLKPILGLLIARAFGTPPIFAAGFILTACVAGAQLSTYASYLSKGDVALSIVLTSLTTISSVIITPVLTGLLIGSVVPVDAIAMSKSILQVVLIPVAMGLALNTYAKPFVNVIRPFMPLMAMVCTSLCIGSPLALNQSQIISMEGLQLVLPVLSFHTFAFVIGYWVAKLPLLRQEENVCRTISLCTGMQSSTLAGLLATQFLGSTNAVPAACSVVAMAIMGLSLASFWGRGCRIRDMPTKILSQLGTSFNAESSNAYS